MERRLWDVALPKDFMCREIISLNTLLSKACLPTMFSRRFFVESGGHFVEQGRGLWDTQARAHRKPRKHIENNS